MPKQGLTEIICVVDKSGSMEKVQDDTIGAFNRFLEDQKKASGTATFSLTLFDTQYELRHSGVPIKDVPVFTTDNYNPGGYTALLDAVAKTIDEVGKRLAATNEADRPEKVLFMILTDGQENSSKEYTLKQVIERIKRQTETYKWQFVFLAAGVEAFEGAVKLGIDKQQICAYAAGDPVKSRCAVQAFSDHTRSYRGGVSPDWSKLNS